MNSTLLLAPFPCKNRADVRDARRSDVLRVAELGENPWKNVNNTVRLVSEGPFHI